MLHVYVLEKEIPSDFLAVGETGLSDISTYGVDDRCRLLMREQVANTARDYELRYQHEETLLHQLIFM